VQPTPNPATSTGTGFAGVSCSSATACTAAGSYTTPGGLPQALAGTWNGTRWRLQATPSPRGAAVSSNLLAVSCTTVTACAATGFYTNVANTTLVLAERWNGTRWILQAAPSPGGARYAELASVSCTSARACTAVGYWDSAHQELTLAERWNGARWTVQPTPNPAGAVYGSDLRGVSCATARACTAVGYYFGKVNSVAFAEAWDGTRWRLQAVPNPATHGQLLGVSCTAPRACTAVGDYGAERWNGTSWRFQPVPAPAGAQGARLSGVSCTARTACTAVGSYFSSTGSPLTLAERWDGKAWTIQPTPNQPSAERNELNGVSCAAASACTAVGDYAANDFTPPIAFAEAWNGTRWSLQAIPGPAGTTSSVLNGASCPAAGGCTATGYRFGLAGPQLTFAATTAG
jgi:hypothetical protein